MTTIKLPTVERLNEIQREWMALDCDAPDKEKKRVFALMDEYPKVTISGHDGLGTVFHNSCPCQARPIPMADAIAYCKALGGRTDVAWNGQRGEWYVL